MKQLQEDEPLVQTTQLSIGGMACGGCVQHVAKSLISLTGVVNVDVDLQKNEATVKHLPDSVDRRGLAAAVRDAGYPAHVSDWGSEPGEAVVRSAARGGSTGCCCQH